MSTKPTNPSANDQLGDNPRCAVSQKCGACQFIELPYDKQLAKKDEAMLDLFADLIRSQKNTPEHILKPILGMHDPYHYRNKVASPFAPARNRKDMKKQSTKAEKNPSSSKQTGGNKKTPAPKLTIADIKTGMYIAGTHELVDTTGCSLENREANAVITAIKRIMAKYNMKPYNEDSGTGFVRHAIVRVGQTSKEMLVTIVTNGEEFVGAKNFCRELVRACPNITTIVQNINTRNTNVILGSNERVLYGPGFILDKLCGLSFRISSQSFYQVNITQTEVLYNAAMDAAGINGQAGTYTAIDAYCGTGTIGLVAAKRGASRVIGVDSVESAIHDARQNAKHNGIQTAEFIAADATEYLTSLAKSERRKPDEQLVLFMDPPRAGSTEEFIMSAAALNPNRIVYISCNPQTQLRDLRQFQQCGYLVKSIQPVDMFPHTPHVETVVLLSRA